MILRTSADHFAIVTQRLFWGQWFQKGMVLLALVLGHASRQFPQMPQRRFDVVTSITKNALHFRPSSYFRMPRSHRRMEIPGWRVGGINLNCPNSEKTLS